MHGQEQHVLIGSKVHESSAQQGTSCQIERPLDFCLRQRAHLCLPIVLGQFLQVHYRHRDVCSWLNDLRG